MPLQTSVRLRQEFRMTALLAQRSQSKQSLHGPLRPLSVEHGEETLFEWDARAAIVRDVGRGVAVPPAPLMPTATPRSLSITNMTESTSPEHWRHGNSHLRDPRDPTKPAQHAVAVYDPSDGDETSDGAALPNRTTAQDEGLEADNVRLVCQAPWWSLRYLRCRFGRRRRRRCSPSVAFTMTSASRLLRGTDLSRHTLLESVRPPMRATWWTQTHLETAVVSREAWNSHDRHEEDGDATTRNGAGLQASLKRRVMAHLPRRTMLTHVCRRFGRG
ncbi:hypothetical protein EK21DRAFT_88116 [Setomelanomma holmii]|uniref:Uncharacterized protein n=1 Tax=Setomelanomma holmii TaxID=210430 RepID=A0A9P4HCX4_9PLEO|nr:hypothetical protein EK21DRAFT_88116 [Setomelanomma holmii]